MRVFVKVLSALGLMLTMAATGPVEAKTPERGDQVMILNVDPQTVPPTPGLFGCPEIFWFGTIELDGTIYGMALYPGPGRFTGQDMINHYEESWKIWTEPFTTTDGSLADCTPGDQYVLAGVDKGTGNLHTGTFRSNGTVDEANAPFTDWLGRRVHQDGVNAMIDYEGLEVPAFGFYGELRLN